MNPTHSMYICTVHLITELWSKCSNVNQVAEDHKKGQGSVRWTCLVCARSRDFKVSQWVLVMVTTTARTEMASSNPGPEQLDNDLVSQQATAVIWASHPADGSYTSLTGFSPCKLKTVQRRWVPMQQCLLSASSTSSNGRWWVSPQDTGVDDSTSVQYQLYDD